VIGIAIVEIEKFSKIREGDFSLWNEVFKKKNGSIALKILCLHSICPAFAAKEVAMKAVRKPSMKLYTAVEIKNKPDGKPRQFFDRKRRQFN
jgi:phosphopantetheinyl transferase (holo-ACP synthase)